MSFWGVLGGIADKLLSIFWKSAKLKADPSYRNEKELEKLANEKRDLLALPSTLDRRKRLAWVDARVDELRNEQNRLAARSS